MNKEYKIRMDRQTEQGSGTNKIEMDKENSQIYR
jgi:hypothetical protein